MTFDESPPPPKTSPLVDDDLVKEEAIEVSEKKLLGNDIKDETLEIDEMVNIKESKKPKNVDEAIKDERWIVAMQAGLNQLTTNDVWKIVPQPKLLIIIGAKWVFRNKLDENGVLSRNKARLVAQGYNQQEAFRLHPYQFTYPEIRLAMEEMLYKFIDEGKREHEEMSAFINEFRTTNELLFKERNNSLSELRFKVYGLSKVINNALISECEGKGVTTRGGKTTTHGILNDNTDIHDKEPLVFIHDKLDAPKEVLVENEPQKPKNKLFNYQLRILLNSNRTRRSRKDDVHLSLWNFYLQENAVWVMQRTCNFSKMYDNNFLQHGGRLYGSVQGRFLGIQACMEVDRAKIDVIAKLPYPTNVKGVRSFLGHAGFYRRFIKDFSMISKPMTQLLMKDVKFDFSNDCSI
uniref:Retrovirus-related Pol polyprotein from transposon TNT 1-94 n=1 Tax=Tanacetum cinerariifolium TaxID=118510 RepID=A0A6L2NDX2_TANCI|nr:retrovirus-related Pol polyprotein from transposon TNT 1-94 [Tanacetum cinerariifolium]